MNFLSDLLFSSPLTSVKGSTYSWGCRPGLCRQPGLSPPLTPNIHSTCRPCWLSIQPYLQVKSSFTSATTPSRPPHLSLSSSWSPFPTFASPWSVSAARVSLFRHQLVHVTLGSIWRLSLWRFSISLRANPNPSPKCTRPLMTWPLVLSLTLPPSPGSRHNGLLTVPLTSKHVPASGPLHLLSPASQGLLPHFSRAVLPDHQI